MVQIAKNHELHSITVYRVHVRLCTYMIRNFQVNVYITCYIMQKLKKYSFFFMKKLYRCCHRLIFEAVMFFLFSRVKHSISKKIQISDINKTILYYNRTAIFLCFNSWLYFTRNLLYGYLCTARTTSILDYINNKLKSNSLRDFLNNEKNWEVSLTAVDRIPILLARYHPPSVYTHFQSSSDLKTSTLYYPRLAQYLKTSNILLPYRNNSMKITFNKHR